MYSQKEGFLVERSGGVFLLLLLARVRNAIRANRLARIIRNSSPYFYSASARLGRIIRISDSRESRH